MVRAILEYLDRDNLEMVQFGFLLLLSLFTFSRAETPCPKTFGGFDSENHWSWGDILPDRYLDGWVMGVRFKGIKQDPRCERPTARGGDWAVVGDVPGSIFSIMHWYKLLVRLSGAREAHEPFFLARDRVRPYTYSCEARPKCFGVPAQMQIPACVRQGARREGRSGALEALPQ